MPDDLSNERTDGRYPSGSGRTARTQPVALRLHRAQDLIEAVPYLLGFRPRDSVVLIGIEGQSGTAVTGSGRVRITARMDIADLCPTGLADDDDTGAARAGAAIRRSGANSVVVMVFIDGPAARSDAYEAAAAAATACAEAGLTVGPLLVVDADAEADTGTGFDADAGGLSDPDAAGNDLGGSGPGGKGPGGKGPGGKGVVGQGLDGKSLVGQGLDGKSLDGKGLGGGGSGGGGSGGSGSGQRNLNGPAPERKPTSRVAAEATYAGLVALEDRRDLVGLLTPEPASRRMRLIARLDAEQQVMRGAGPEARRRRRGAIRALFAATRTLAVVGDGDLVRFGAALSTTEVRDACWLAVEAGRIDGEPLWRELGRRLPGPYDAAPLFLFGWQRWRHGDGVLAGIAARRALDSDAGYNAAHLLDTAVSDGLDPYRTPRLRKGA